MSSVCLLLLLQLKPKDASSTVACYTEESLSFSNTPDVDTKHPEIVLDDLKKRMEVFEPEVDNFDKEIKENAKILESIQRDISLSELMNKDGQGKAVERTFWDFSESRIPPASNMQCRWAVPNVSRLFMDEPSLQPIVSPPWYTQQCGYCMQAFLLPEQGQFTSFYMSAIPGQHDDFLPWPLYGSPIFSILDPKRRHRHYVKRCLLGSKNGFTRPANTGQIVAAGLSNLIETKTLMDNYVKDDTIFFEMGFSPTL